MKPSEISLRFLEFSKSYGDKAAVDGLVLRADGGEIFGFLGPNGAGKTTTLQCVMGLRQPTGGDIQINGVSVQSPAIHPMRRRIGFLPETTHLYEHLTGREFIEFMAGIYRVPPARMDDLEELLARFEMAADADALVETYSAGMRRKIAIIASVLPLPDVYIFDEPLSSLDTASARVTKDLMLEARDAGALVFFTSHRMEFVEEIADRVGIIHDGRLLLEGTPQDLRTSHGTAPRESLESVFLRLTGGRKGTRGTP